MSGPARDDSSLGSWRTDHPARTRSPRSLAFVRRRLTSQKNAVTTDQACEVMRSHARSNNASLRTVAETIVAVGLRV